MNTKQVFIILVATLFLAVSIGGAQAGTTVRGSKSNSSDVSSPSPSDANTIASSKSNSSDRKAVKDPNKGDPAEATTVRGSKSNTSF
jgi:hypothetical protein